MGFTEFKNSIVETSKNFTASVKRFGRKTLNFTGDQLADTPLFIENSEEYAKRLTDKRVIIIAFHEDAVVSSDVVLFMPIWGSQAFIDSATIRYMNYEHSNEVVEKEGYKFPIEMRIFFEGVETYRMGSFGDIKVWWKNRYYNDEERAKVLKIEPETQKDIIANAEKEINATIAETKKEAEIETEKKTPVEKKSAKKAPIKKATVKTTKTTAKADPVKEKAPEKKAPAAKTSVGKTITKK